MSISSILPVTGLEDESSVIDLRRGAWVALRLAGQLALFWSLLNAGSLLSSKLALPLPGNLLGLLLMLVLLSAGVVQPAWVHELASILIRHLVLFFIPQVSLPASAWVAWRTRGERVVNARGERPRSCLR